MKLEIKVNAGKKIKLFKVIHHLSDLGDFWLFHCLPVSARADERLAEGAEPLG